MKSSSDCEFSAFDAMQGESFILEPGQMIIWSHALTHLKEHTEYLEHRATYFNEVPGKAEYIEKLQDITARISQIIKTHQGEA